MADFTKIIKFVADTSRAKSGIDEFFKDIGKQSELVTNKIRNMFKADKEYAEAYDAALKIFDKIDDTTRKLNIAQTLGDISDVKKYTAALSAAFDELKTYDLSNATNFTGMIETQLFAAEEERSKKIAESAQNALMSFVGLDSELRKIASEKADISSLGLDPALTAKVNIALEAQEQKLKDIAKLQAKLKALQLAGEGKSKEAKDLAKQIEAMQGKPSTFGGKLGADAMKGLRDLSPFSKERREKFKENGKYNTVLGASIGKIGKHFGDVMANAIKNVGKFFYNTFKNAFEELSKMGTYSAGTTLISNRSAREQQLTFGLSAAQNYAMTTAMRTMGMSGIEDLFWMNAKQQEQYNKMTEILEAQYNKLESSGIMETTQQFQLDMAMMKLQFQNTVYQFIAAHKGALEKVLSLALTFMEGVLDFLGIIVDGISAVFGGGNYSSSDVLASSSSNTTTNTDNSKVINATVNYTNNESESAGSGISESVLNQLIAVLNG